jgi:hypothetical protein
MDTSQAVARIQRLQSKLNKVGPIGSPGYVAGQFYRVMQKPGLANGTSKVHALVFRGDMVAVAKENMLLQLHDRLCTGPDTLALIEFLIGGRVSVNSSTEVIVDTERSVVDGNNGAARTGNKALASLFKLDARALKQPLEIQTNGGTMAIKG